jgi:hypothetical protein
MAPRKPKRRKKRPIERIPTQKLLAAIRDDMRQMAAEAKAKEE